MASVAPAPTATAAPVRAHAHSHTPTPATVTRTTAYDDLPMWLSVHEAAAYEGVIPGTIYQRCRENRMPHVRRGKFICIPREVYHPSRAHVVTP